MKEKQSEHDLVKLVSLIMGSAPVSPIHEKEDFEAELIKSMALRDRIAYLFGKGYEIFEA
jgi:hypothetical protein|tara:strand:+ start:31069 stop:31248 length:180 start_codon:yes stop_codon:yes gene_type:complete